MAIDKTNWNPRIDYSDDVFVFGAHGVSVVGPPNLAIKGRYIRSEVPNNDGGMTYPAGKKPLSISVDLKIESVDPAVVIATLAALRLAVEGRGAGISTWSQGYFRFYLHYDESGNVLWWDRCSNAEIHCDLMSGKGYLGQKNKYTPVRLTFEADDPEIKTSAAGAEDEDWIVENQCLIIRQPTGHPFIICEDTTAEQTTSIHDSGGEIRTIGEFSEYQSDLDS